MPEPNAAGTSAQAGVVRHVSTVNCAGVVEGSVADAAADSWRQAASDGQGAAADPLCRRREPNACRSLASAHKNAAVVAAAGGLSMSVFYMHQVVRLGCVILQVSVCYMLSNTCEYSRAVSLSRIHVSNNSSSDILVE